MVNTPEQLREFARVMRDEGIAYFEAAPDGAVKVYLAPGGPPPKTRKPGEEEDETDDPPKSGPRKPYHDPDLWPGGRVPRLTDPDGGVPDPGDILE